MSRISLRRLSERADLSVPRGSPQMGARYDADAFGRFAEGMARFLGTGRFIVGQTVLVVGWIILNTIGAVKHWDPYPFILLNLAFSTQAAYAAPLILLAQNRQDDRDRANIDRDREVAARTQADTEFLARELAAVRLALADMVTTQDLEDSLSRLAKANRRPAAPGRVRRPLVAGRGVRVLLTSKRRLTAHDHETARARVPLKFLALRLTGLGARRTRRRPGRSGSVRGTYRANAAFRARRRPEHRRSYRFSASWSLYPLG